MTWNVLADSYVKPEWFRHVDPALFVPEARRAAVVAQARGFEADVLCLQEVEAHVFEALRADLAPRGYDGAWARKGRDKPDGCAAFVRAGRDLTLRGLGRFEYPDGTGHVAQVLRLTLAGRALVVLNTHLRWAPPADPEHVGARQAEALAAARTTLDPDAEGWAVCGDLNGEPGGPVARALEAAGLGYAERSDAPTCNANARAKKIDYVFVSDALRADAERPRELTATEPLPAPGDASDHLPLRAALGWRAP